MKYILPNLTAVLWAAITASLAAQETPKPTDSKPNSPLNAAEMLLASADTVAREPSFQAEFRHRVELLHRSMVGKGVYRQATQGSFRKHRLELTLRVGDESSSVQQASNGRFLWIRRDFPGRRNVTRLDLREVQRAKANAKIAPNEMADETSLHLLGMDGLPGALAGIAECFDLHPPQKTSIGEDAGWLIEGQMKSTFLQRLAPKQDPKDLSRLPEHIPTHVAVVLSKASAWPLFPVRIEYRRGRKDGKLTPLVAMEFSNVVRRARFEAMTFEFPAGEESQRDITSEFIKRLAKK